VLDITPGSPSEALSRGIADMIAYPSGNFRIDEPFLDEMYRVVATRSKNETRQMLRVLTSSPFPMERFILNHPGAAAALLASDLGTAARAVVESDPVVFSPAQFLYRLVYVDPGLAARLVQRLEERGERELVVESLARFAYDADRLEMLPGLPISLEKDGQFLARLLEGRGAEWVETRLKESVALYRGRVERREVASDFLEAYHRTIEGAISLVKDTSDRRTLEQVTAQAFR
jgi:hypothetical protein